MFAVACDALARSHSPYSGYPVGAAVRTRSGAVYTGCNVENAAYPLGTCAEAGAIAAMVLGGERDIVEVVTVTRGPVPGTPCGGCRQRIREFAGPEVVVHATTVDGDVRSATVAELLPWSFGPELLDDPER
jgi:cytidine deaminase